MKATLLRELTDALIKEMVRFRRGVHARPYTEGELKGQLTPPVKIKLAILL